MKIIKKFNQLTIEEYFFFIDNYKDYSDFNTLGLYRSLTENGLLDKEERIKVREYAHRTFGKTFEFLQIKDPETYFQVSTMDREMTRADINQFWIIIRENQQKILRDKKIKHRNFGAYSKHNCGIDTCPYNGLMIKKGSVLTEDCIYFKSDKSKLGIKEKSKRFKSDRKNKKKIIRNRLENE